MKTLIEVRQNSMYEELFSFTWNEDSVNRIVFSNRDSSFWCIKDPHQNVAPPMDY